VKLKVQKNSGLKVPEFKTVHIGRYTVSQVGFLTETGDVQTKVL